MINNRDFSDKNRTTVQVLNDTNLYSWLSYTGEYILPNWVKKFLHQKVQREGLESYEERCLQSDPALHFATVVDELTGMVFGLESEADRQFSKPDTGNFLGELEDNTSVASAIYKDVDGTGKNWITFLKEIGQKICVMNPNYILVDGVVGDQSARILHIFSHQIKAEHYDNFGNLVDVTVRFERYKTGSWNKPPEIEEYFIRYTLDGWEEYLDLDGNAVNFGEYEFYKNYDRKQKILPIFKAQLPLSRNVGYLLARKQNVLFNQDSIRDFSIRNVTFNLLEIVGTDEEYNSIVDNLTKGSNAIQGNPNYSRSHNYIGSNPAMISEITAVLEKKVEQFYKSAFKEYADAARLQTATAIVQKAKSSLDTFLVLLSDALDEIENNMFWRLTQIYNPLRPELWGDSYVLRSKDFSAFDPNVAVKELTERYFADGLPTNENVLKQALKQVYQYDSIIVPDSEISEIIDEEELEKNEPQGLVPETSPTGSLNPDFSRQEE